ncbi:MAG: efflux RND transporter periplasmic adaptor subunit [Phycisphaerae bacterium]
MNRYSTLALFLALALGLGAGAIGTYSWLVASNGPGGSSRPEGHDDHGDGAADHDEHGDEHGHAGHNENEDGLVRLSPAVLEEFGIDVRRAGAGEVARLLTVPGEVVLNADQVAHIVPRVAGIVQRVDKRIGDHVATGEVMAVLESRELAEAKAAYLAAVQRLSLAEATFVSSQALKADGILPELEFLAAQKDRDQAGIEVRTAEHKLHARGLTNDEILGIPREADRMFSEYELRAPFSGTVIEKHITLGEAVGRDSDVFLLADLETVWVFLTVYQKDLAAVRAGQSVRLSCGPSLPETTGVIDYVSPVVEEATRTATARAVLPNPEGHWRPGLFVTGRLKTGTAPAAIVVPKSAVQMMRGRSVVFVETGAGFIARPVRLGRSDTQNVEITEGLDAGARYAAVGAFNLKAEMVKESFAGGGHAH